MFRDHKAFVTLVSCSMKGWVDVLGVWFLWPTTYHDRPLRVSFPSPTGKQRRNPSTEQFERVFDCVRWRCELKLEIRKSRFLYLRVYPLTPMIHATVFEGDFNWNEALGCYFFLFFSYRVGEIMRCLWMYNDLCMFVNCIIIYANTCYIWMIHITFSLNTYMWVHQLQHLPWKKHLFFSSLSSKTDPTNQGPSRSLSFVTVLCGRVRGKTWIFDAILVVGWDHLEGPLAIGPARDVETTGNQKIGDKLNKATFFTGRNAF